MKVDHLESYTEITQVKNVKVSFKWTQVVSLLLFHLFIYYFLLRHSLNTGLHKERKSNLNFFTQKKV